MKIYMLVSATVLSLNAHDQFCTSAVRLFGSLITIDNTRKLQYSVAAVGHDMVWPTQSLFLRDTLMITVGLVSVAITTGDTPVILTLLDYYSCASKSYFTL